MDKPGSLYIRASLTNKNGWRLMRQFFEGKKRVHKTVRKQALLGLGFTQTMTIDQAKARASQLNAQNAVSREQTRKMVSTADRLHRDHLFSAAFVPKELNLEFIAWMTENTSGKAKYTEKMLIHWASAKKAIIKLALTPDEYAVNKKRFYLYFSAQEYSFSYAQKLLRTINMYGVFVSRRTGIFYEQIPGPRGHDREKINDAYLDSDSFFGPSEPMTPQLLEKIRSNFTEEQYRWLFCTVWFGLRPSELDMIMADKKRESWRVDQGEVDVLWVYQPKLTSLPRPKRWKPIPILFDQQKVALGYLTSELDKPLTKTIKKYAEQHVTLYGGRKNFTDLMLDRGQKLEDVAQWLGHTSLEMTWTHYKNKARVGFTVVKKSDTAS